MLAPIPLPEQPLTILWQSTVVDIEPGSRYGYKSDAAAVNTTLAVVNRGPSVLEFPLLLATTSPDPGDATHRRIRVGSTEFDDLEGLDSFDDEWNTLAAAMRQNAVNQGHNPAFVDAYLDALRPRIEKAFRSRNRVRLDPGEEKFIRSHHRKKLKPSAEGTFEFRGLFPLPQFILATGGTLSVVVALPRNTQKFPVDLLDWTRNFSPQAFGKDPGLPLVSGRFVVTWMWQNDPELFVSYHYPGQPGRLEAA